MSRAAYIWIVLGFPSGDLLAAFTVKYECADWLARYAQHRVVDVFRMRDSHTHPGGAPVRLDPGTLEPFDQEGKS